MTQSKFMICLQHIRGVKSYCAVLFNAVTIINWYELDKPTSEMRKLTNFEVLLCLTKIGKPSM